VKCDVCGDAKAVELTADERRAWPSVAVWIRRACPTCRAMFRRSAEKAAA
jgi:transcriptional regulator NrdR family protein